MRTTFVKTLLALAKENPDIVLITGDLGFTVLEEFRDTLPKQYLNAGVAEQNMIGVAAGMAMMGKRVFVYSIIPFATFRCLEQTRNDVCYHQLPVCVVGVGAGYSYGHQGSTHHALEDIAVMRSLSHMNVICPGDPLETESAVRGIVEWRKPCYLRLGKAGEPKIHISTPTMTLGKAFRLHDGKDVTLIATGTMLETANATRDLLEKDGMSVRLVSMPCVKPVDVDELAAAVRETKLVVTIEEHGPIGGLGSAVAETYSLNHLSGTPHLLLSAPATFADCVGSQAFLRERAGLTPALIQQAIMKTLAR